MAVLEVVGALVEGEEGRAAGLVVAVGAVERKVAHLRLDYNIRVRLMLTY